jgi:hypothetical protein
VGCLHPDFLNRFLTIRQIREWIAYYNLEPFGEIRADWRQAMTSMILANANRGKKGRTYKVKDFMLTDKKKRRQQTPEEMQAMLNLLC